jgi:alanine dehydrogenase
MIGDNIMIIGIPKEVKKNEFRVASIPEAVVTLVNNGHTVLVEKNAGIGSGFTDVEYEKAGAQITLREVLYKNCDMIYKVKEIEAIEYDLLHENQIVLTYLHSNAHLEMTNELLKRKITGVCYEDIDDEQGEYPMLAPMSMLAGKGGFLAALNFSQSVHGGRGLLLNRIVGVPTPEITIIGCGWSGVGAAELAASFGNKVTMLDISKKAMESAKNKLPINVEFLFSNRENLLNCLKRTDVVINCILWPKDRKDHLVSREDLKLMKRGAFIIDVACDNEGAIETCRSTTHDNPIYYEEGVLHYAVDNIPSGFAETASQMLSESTLPYALKIANLGVKEAMSIDAHLRRGLTTYKGMLTLKETAIKHGIPFVDPLIAIGKE